MNFKVYIGNPPYQHGNRSIYQEFIRQAYSVGAEYACLIVNNNWIEGNTHKKTREFLINNGLHTIVNYSEPGEVFEGVHVAVSIVQYAPMGEHKENIRFIQQGKEQTIRVDADYTIVFEDDNSKDSIGASIVEKVLNREYCNTWELAKNARIWSIASNGYHMYSNYTEDIYNWIEESDIKQKLGEAGEIGYDNNKYIRVAFLNESKQMYFRYITRESLVRGHEYVDMYKVICGSKAQTTKNVISNIHILQPGEICTNSFGIVGLAETKDKAEFMYKYANTKFFRYLVLKAISGIKVSFGTGCTKYVPLISEGEIKEIENLSIEELNEYFYKKYELTDVEIDTIDKTVN